MPPVHRVDSRGAASATAAGTHPAARPSRGIGCRRAQEQHRTGPARAGTPARVPARLARCASKVSLFARVCELTPIRAAFALTSSQTCSLRDTTGQRPCRERLGLAPPEVCMRDVRGCVEERGRASTSGPPRRTRRGSAARSSRRRARSRSGFGSASRRRAPRRRRAGRSPRAGSRRRAQEPSLRGSSR